MMMSVIIFDLDGTLYRSAAIKKKFAEAAYHTLAKFQDISLDQARICVEEKRGTLQQEHGFSVPYTLALQSLGVPIAFWHDESIKFFDPGDYLQEDTRLRQTLIRLRKHYRLALLTNNSRVQTDRTLRALGVLDLFHPVYSYNTFNLLKPSRELLKKVLRDLEVTPAECCLVGDRYPVDIRPALDLGMKAHQVAGPEDVYTLSDNNFSQEEK